jgi:hypothetical protein
MNRTTVFLRGSPAGHDLQRTLRERNNREGSETVRRSPFQTANPVHTRYFLLSCSRRPPFLGCEYDRRFVTVSASSRYLGMNKMRSIPRAARQQQADAPGRGRMPGAAAGRAHAAPSASGSGIQGGMRVGAFGHPPPGSDLFDAERATRCNAHSERLSPLAWRGHTGRREESTAGPPAPPAPAAPFAAARPRGRDGVHRDRRQPAAERTLESDARWRFLRSPGGQRAVGRLSV